MINRKLTWNNSLQLEKYWPPAPKARAFLAKEPTIDSLMSEIGANGQKNI